MAQQISPEAALAAFREQYGRVADENVLLRAHASQLEARVSELEARVRELEAASEPQAGQQDPYPAMAGPVAEQG